MTRPDIISREQWGATRSSPSAMIHPTGVALHWAGTKMGIYRPEQYPAVVRGIEKYHELTRGWDDIAYNWLVDPYGKIYEGRGEFRRSAANGTNVGNTHAEAICYIGGDGDPFTQEAARGISALVVWRRRSGVGLKVWTHDDFRPTSCPGEEMRRFAMGGYGEVQLEPVPEVYRWQLRPTMREGSNGLHVIEWKRRLHTVLGRWIGDSPEFGPTTKLVTMEFQQAIPGLEVDGIAGPKTQNAMQWIGVAGGKF